MVNCSGLGILVTMPTQLVTRANRKAIPSVYSHTGFSCNVSSHTASLCRSASYGSSTHWVARSNPTVRAGQRGVTLPELMVVVVILGVLSSSAVATYKERVAAARSTEAVAMLSVVQKSAERGVAIADAYGASALNLQVNTFGAAKSFGKGNNKGNKDADLDNDGNNGHGNNEGKCDPSNPGNSKDCEDPGVGSTGLCGSAQPVPSDFAKVKGATYAASGSDYASGDGGNGWKCLGASRSGNQHYQYGYDLGEGTVSGSSESYTAWARGDLDGDGRNSLFRMRGENVDGNVIHAPTIEIVDGTE